MLSEFYCKYCGTTQYLKPRKNRVTCGNDECTKKKRAWDLREERKKEKPKKKKKINPKYVSELPKKEAYKLTPTKTIHAYGYWHEYGIDEEIGDINSKEVFFFGKNYTISSEKSTSKAIVTDITNETYLVIYNYKVQIRSKREPLVV